MFWLRYGDRYATVGTMQHLLNMAVRKNSRLGAGPPLIEDGIFGKLSRRRVIEVQKGLGVRPATGVFGPATWSALRPILKCRVVDVSDLAIENLLERLGEAGLRQNLRNTVRPGQRNHPDVTRRIDKTIRNFKKEIRACRAQHQRSLAMGGSPIPVLNPRDALDTVRRGILARSQGGWSVVLLRFTGHGGPASQGVAASLVRERSIRPGTLRYDDSDTAEQLVETLVTASLAGPMPKWASIELHGCSVGARRVSRQGAKRTVRDGPAFVQQFADTVGRPVTASTVGDSYGTLQLDARFDAGVVSCVPGGGCVRDWFRNAAMAPAS